MAIALVSGCGGGAGNSPLAIAAFRHRALAAIYDVTNAGIGFRGHALLHLRQGMLDKERVAAAGAMTLSRQRPPSFARSVNGRVVAMLWKLYRDFARAQKRSVEAALGTDAGDVQGLVRLRSAVSAVPSY